jgi:hypothetical protein
MTFCPQCWTDYQQKELEARVESEQGVLRGGSNV